MELSGCWCYCTSFSGDHC